MTARLIARRLRERDARQLMGDLRLQDLSRVVHAGSFGLPFYPMRHFDVMRRWYGWDVIELRH